MIGIKEYNKKITTLGNMRKMTKTMKMVSATKFKRAHKVQANAQLYLQKLTELMGHFLNNTSFLAHPLLITTESPTRPLIVMFTSDRGLCGGFNNNLIRKTRQWIFENPYSYTTMSMGFYGRRGYTSFRRSVKVHKYYENMTPSWQDAVSLAQDITQSFINNDYEEIFLAYNRFSGSASYSPVIEKILPLDVSVLKSSEIRRTDYIYEPDDHELLSGLISKFMNVKIYYTLLENAAGEHAARMLAMDKASENTADLIDRYTLLKNRARQAAITTELNEIISGKEALQ